MLDATTLSEYLSAMAGVGVNFKRSAGATAIINAMGNTQRLSLKRDGVTVMTVDYTGAMLPFNDGTDIGVTLTAPVSSSVVGTGDIDTGTWTAELTGAAAFRIIRLTVGKAGSGKQYILDADVVAGEGIKPVINLIIPRSVDGLA
jgi:hypothetical protein